MENVFEHFLDRSLAHVVRFNSRPQHFPESVAEHSFYVTYFASILLFFLKRAGEEVSEARTLKIALIHDMEEAFSGDILTPFKHYNDEVLATIRKVNQETISKLLKKLPDELSQEFIELWNEELKQESKEAQVAKLSDKLSLIAKCYEEMKVGNEFFRPIYDRELSKLYNLEYGWWQKIKGEILP